MESGEGLESLLRRNYCLREKFSIFDIRLTVVKPIFVEVWMNCSINFMQSYCNAR